MEATFIDRKVSEIWETVNRKNRQLMKDWIEGFIGSYDEQKQKSQQEIRNTAIRLTEPGENFLWRLMSAEPSLHGYYDRNGIRKRRVELAMLFLRAMTEDKYWTSFITLTLSLGHSKISRSVPVSADSDTTQPCIELYKAARLEKVEEVRRLIETGLRVKPNVKGFTPLHSAAMAINPNARIAHLLLELGDGQQHLDIRAGTAENTALHYAAANVNVTEDFIVQFMDADPELRNVDHYTPFHVAAMSCNPDAIIYMLNTFAPTNKGWDVDKVDEESAEKVINLCARNGNAKAVALLIKHGADISRGVLHEIVLESIRNPAKIDKLVGVYQTVVDNAVIWRCLEEEREFMEFYGSDEYFRETMIWLLTNHVKDDDGEELYEGRDVLQCALAHGASDMFREIINTKSVFRTDGNKVWEWIGEESSDEGKDQKTREDRNKRNWTVYDVTNFTKETRSRAAVRDSSESTAVCLGHPQDTSHELSLLAGQEDDHLTSGSYVNRDFDDLPIPEEPYLTYLLMAFNHWKDSDILSTQPLNGLIRPYIALVQRFCFLLGLMQLIYMVLLTAYNMPTPCSLAFMFNLNFSSTSCGSRTTNSSDNEMTSTASQQRPPLSRLWIIWPTILFLGSLYIIVHRAKLVRLAHKFSPHKTVFTAKDQKFSIAKEFSESHLLPILLLIFCCTVYLWVNKYIWSDTYESYVEVIGMVLLLGWITNLAFFEVMSKDASIFALVVRKIIVKNMPSFMLYFVFVVVGFSFAMHTLRMATCKPNELMHLDETFFSVLSGAFGVGDFFEVTMTDSKCVGAGTKYLIEFVYFCYMCATMIILLNILIAMMNNAYEKAKRRAGNIWRFQMLSLVTVLESHRCLVKLMTKLGILDLWRPGENLKKIIGCYAGCCYTDENRASLFYNDKRKRYYLKLMLPVDERVKKPQ